MPRNLAQSDTRFRDALADVLKHALELPGALVTLVDTHITPDTKHATGVLSVLPTSMESTVLHAVRDAEADIKQALGKRLRFRRMPALHWKFDRTEEGAADIEADLHQLKQRGEL